MPQYISLNLAFDFCSKIMATRSTTSRYNNILYPNIKSIIHQSYIRTHYHHNSNHVSEIPRPLILFIGVCHKLYFCGIELSSINLWSFCAWNFGEEEYSIAHQAFPMVIGRCCAMLRSKMGDCAKNPCHFLQKHKYYSIKPEQSKVEACFAKIMLPCG